MCQNVVKIWSKSGKKSEFLTTWFMKSPTGFEEDVYPTAEKSLCGFEEFYAAFEWYLDNLIVDFYEKKSGIRIPINKPKDRKYMKNLLKVPPEVGHKYPLDVPKLIDSEDFIKNEPHKLQTDEKCKYKWEIFRGTHQDLYKINTNHALLMYPGSSKNENESEPYTNPALPQYLGMLPSPAL